MNLQVVYIRRRISDIRISDLCRTRIVYAMKTIRFRDLVRHPMHLVASGFGVGLLPYAPGTAGTLLAVPVVFFIQFLPVVLQCLICLVMFIFGCLACQSLANAIQQDDPGVIVWDETTGFCFAALLLPVTFWSIAVAFVLFRALDILKPWPISALERKFKGGLGIMLDDLAAGFFTNIFVHLLLYFEIL